MELSEVAERELAALDPYAIQDAEAARVDAFLSGLDEAGWTAVASPTEWTRREMVAHLAATEEYFQAGLDDALGTLFERGTAAGVSDLNSFNAWGVSERAGQSAEENQSEWRGRNAITRQGFRRRGTQDMATSVGDYPANWQAFHAAMELATHADDLAVPVTTDEATSRASWRAGFARFALVEVKSDLTATAVDGGTHVSGADVDVTLDDESFVAAVMGRLSDDDPIDPGVRAALLANG